MALSNGRGSNNGPLVYLNARSKDKDKKKVPSHFEIARKNAEGKIEKTGETCTRVSGDLQRPFFSMREFEGVPQKEVTLYIRDNDANETYSLKCSYRIATRQLFNGILSLTDPKGIEISIWDKTSKTDPKKSYEALSLWQNEKLVPWKFDGRNGEIPEPEKVTFKGKDMSDYTATDDFFETELKAWADEIFGPEKPRRNTTAQTQEQVEEPAEEVVQEEVQEQAPAPAPRPAARPVAQKPVAAAPAAKPTATKTAVAKPAPKPAARPVAKPVQEVAPAQAEDEGDPFAV